MRLTSAHGRLKYAAFIIILLIADRLTKAWATWALAPLPEDMLPALGGIARFRYVLNSGAAFSILRQAPALVTILSLVVLIPLCAIILFSRFSRPKTLYCVSLVFAGGLGNFADRLSRGAVIDFIELLFIRFPVFNFADICVSAGAIGFACLLFAKGGAKKDTADQTQKAQNEISD